MQKLEKKQNANPVGATSSRPHFEGITKKQKRNNPNSINNHNNSNDDISRGNSKCSIKWRAI